MRPSLVASGLGLALWQQPAPITTIQPAVAQMVMVDAFVVDRKGRPVTDLKVEDFALLEDDKNVSISAFVAPGALAVAPSGAPSGDPAAAALPRGEPLTLVLYVDRRLLGPAGRRRAIDQAFGIAESHLAQGARAVVIADDHGLRPLTPITTDPAVVRAALTRIQGWATTSPSTSDARSALENVKTVIQGNMLSGCDCVCSLPQSLQIVRGYATARDIEAREASDRLTFLVSALIGVSGRKSLLYVSEGLEDRPGLQLYDQLRRICPQAEIKEGSSIFAAMHELETAPTFREMTARANAARVTIYPIAAQGLTGLSSASDISQPDRTYVASAGNDMLRNANLNAPLQRMGDDTGGFALLNGLDPKTAMKRFNALEQGHYILGFVPGEADGKVHRLWLRLAGIAQDKRKVDITHRESYLRAALPARRGQRAMSALLFGLEEGGLESNIDVERMAPNTARVHISVALASLTPLSDSPSKEGLVQLVIAFRSSRAGAPTPTVREKEVTLSLAEGEMNKDQGRHDITVDVPVEEGAIEFSIGIEDVVSGRATYVQRKLPARGARKSSRAFVTRSSASRKQPRYAGP